MLEGVDAWGRRVWKVGINDIGVVLGVGMQSNRKYLMAFSQFWKSDGGGNNEVFPLEGRERA